MLRWADELYQIYERFCGQPIGGDTAVLLPMAHSTANAQIEVTLSEDGIFQAAKKIEDKKDAVTIIPVTENSGSRSSGITPHPLADKLIYLAGDYGNYVPEKAEKASKSYAAYLEQLKIWAEENHSHPAVRAIYTYLQKGCLIQDLLAASVLNLDEQTGKLGKEKICEVVQSDCMVRFRVYQLNPGSRDETWLDSTLYESWIEQNEEQNASQQVRQLCYATGKVTECSYKHPNKIRNAGDKAKLFSANDESGFSYRGRFQNKEQAVSIGYDFSQKMHNALRWMIQRQGYSISKTMTVLAWESNLEAIVNGINLSSHFKTFFCSVPYAQFTISRRSKEKISNSFLLQYRHAVCSCHSFKFSKNSECSICAYIVMESRPVVAESSTITVTLESGSIFL